MEHLATTPKIGISIALALALWLCCAEIGMWILPKRSDGRRGLVAIRQDPWNQVGVAACVGLGVLLALGGISSATGASFWLTVVAFAVTGGALGLLRIRRNRSGWPSSVSLALAVLVVVAFVVLAGLEGVNAVRIPVNPCDDLRAYLPMVRRLLATGSILEPWSIRRLQQYGGQSFLQALPVGIVGDAGIGVAETIFAGVFLGGLIIGSPFRSVGARVIVAVALVAVPFLWVPRISVAAALLPVPLLVAGLGVTTELRRALRGSERAAALRWSIAAGLLIAAVTSIRPPLGIAAVATFGLGAITIPAASWKARAQALCVTGAFTVLAMLGWFVAAWRAVGSPLYPLVAGNANAHIPLERDTTLNSASEILHNSMRQLGFGTFFGVALGILVFAVIARRLLADPGMIAIAGTVAVAFLVFLTFAISMSSAKDFGRYVAPIVDSAAVFCIYESARMVGTEHLGAGRPFWRDAFLILPLVLVVIVFLPIRSFDPRSGALMPSGYQLLLGSSDLPPTFSTPPTMTPPALRKAYKRALARIDSRARTILAVDRPYLVDYSGPGLENMDFPGFAAPGGNFPFFTGVIPKIRRLRTEGYDTLVATAPDRDLCLSPATLKFVALNFPKPSGIYARYDLDWENGLTKIAIDAPEAVKRVGPLLIIDLPMAERVLRSAKDSTRSTE